MHGVLGDCELRLDDLANVGKRGSHQTNHSTWVKMIATFYVYTSVDEVISILVALSVSVRHAPSTRFPTRYCTASPIHQQYNTVAHNSELQELNCQAPVD